MVHIGSVPSTIKASSITVSPSTIVNSNSVITAGPALTFMTSALLVSVWPLAPFTKSGSPSRKADNPKGPEVSQSPRKISKLNVDIESAGTLEMVNVAVLVPVILVTPMLGPSRK